MIYALTVVFALLLFVAAPRAQILDTGFEAPFRLKDLHALRGPGGQAEILTVGGNGTFSIRRPPLHDTSKISDADLTSLFVLGDRTIWVVGNEGEILLSTDRGQTWQKQASGTKSDLTSVHCIDSGQCWATGFESGLVLSGGAGRPWKAENVVYDGRLTGVYFVDRSVGFIVGWDGLVLRTMDGGKNWMRISLPYNCTQRNL